MNPPNDQEIEMAADILRRLPRGFLPFEIFTAFAERTVMPCLELSIFRRHGDKIEILLTQREPDDPHFPSAWHLPGGVLRATDKEGDYSSIIRRTLDGELQSEQHLLYEPRFALHYFQETNRGKELVIEYFSEVAYSEDSPKIGVFFPVDELPEGLLSHYKITFPKIIKAFEQSLNL